MPGGDRTGPGGRGPMTGRGAGFCSGYNAPGFMNPAPGYGYGYGIGRGYGRGWGRGYGRGWGFRRGYAPEAFHPGYNYPAYDDAYAPEVNEKEFLNDQVKYLENQVNQMKKRLDEISQDSE